MSQFNKYLEIVQERKDYSYNESILGDISNFVMEKLGKQKGLSLADKAYKLIDYSINGFRYSDARGFDGTRKKSMGDLGDYIRNNKNAKYTATFDGKVKTVNFLVQDGILGEESKGLTHLKEIYDEIIKKYGDFFEIGTFLPGEKSEGGMKLPITLNFDKLYNNLYNIIKDASGETKNKLKELEDFLTYYISGRSTRVNNQ